MQSFRRLFLPYALMNMRDGRFLPLNRDYKPATNPQSSTANWRRYEAILARVSGCCQLYQW
jgi:hypothetical protein